MIIDEKLKNNMKDLRLLIEYAEDRNSLTDLQLEKFLRAFEQVRYNLLNEIKIYNKTVDYEYEKIKTIDDDYKAEVENNILKIYVPEVMPSFKNIKTHTYKRILLNISEITKEYKNLFQDEVCIFIKVYDKLLGWDIDNKYIKPVADALIASEVIKDDNITKMFYCVRGEFSEVPHTEIFVFDSKKMNDFLENTTTQNCHF